MRFELEIKGRETFLTVNNKTTKHNTAFLKKLSVSDFFQCLIDNNLKGL